MWLMRATHSRGTSSVLLPLLPPRMPFAACFVSLRRCWPTCIACSPVLPRAFRSSTRPSLPAALTRAPPHPPAPTPHPRPSCFTCLRRRRAAAGCAARLRSPRSSSLTAHAGLSQSSHRNYFFLLVEKDTVSFTRTCSLEALKCHFVNAACCTSPPVAQSSTSSAAKRCARTRAAAASAWAADAPGWGAGPAGAQLPRPAHPATNACREAFEPRRCLGRWRPPEKLRALVRGAQLGSLSASERP